MEHHDHDHHFEPAAKVDPDQTARLKVLALDHEGTPLAHFAYQAAKAPTPYARAYWVRRLEGAEHAMERAEGRERLAQAERASLERWERTAGTEASLALDRVVGNGVVLKLVPGLKRPTGGYSLVRRRAGETRGTGEGRPQPDGEGGLQWVVQDLPLGEVAEFVAVSEDESGHAEVTGPVLAVPIGDVSTDVINAAAAAEAKREHDEAEAAAAEHTARVQRERIEHAEALQAQGEAARAANERREAEIAAKMELHRQAVEDLPKCAPRELNYKVRALPGGAVVCDVSFRRGLLAPDIYQFALNGSVLGYYPDGRHSGRRAPDHLYQRSIEIPPGRTSRIRVYGVTKHGDAEVAFDVAPIDPPVSRQEMIVGAVRGYSGPRTRGYPAGRPYLRPLRAQSGLDDITGGERDAAFRIVSPDSK